MSSSAAGRLMLHASLRPFGSAGSWSGFQGAALVLAEVGGLHLGIGLDLGRGALRDLATEVEHVDATADPHDEIDVVLDQQDGEVVGGQFDEQVGEPLGL